jgi:hypothetical protein
VIGLGFWRAGWSAAWLWLRAVTGSGRSGDAGPGDVAGGELVEGVERGGELGWGVGPVRCHQRAEHVVVDLGVEVREQQPVAGEVVAVPAGDALDQAVANLRYSPSWPGPTRLPEPANAPHTQ